MPCRDRYGSSNATRFRVRTCVSCYKYLFRALQPAFIPLPFGVPDSALIARPRNLSLLLASPAAALDGVERHLPDVRDGATLGPVCASLTRKQCELWLQCCGNAARCCERQRALAEQDRADDCPATWDGYACWGPAPAGTVARTPCPDYVSVGVDRPFGNREYKKNEIIVNYEMVIIRIVAHGMILPPARNRRSGSDKPIQTPSPAHPKNTIRVPGDIFRNKFVVSRGSALFTVKKSMVSSCNLNGNFRPKSIPD